MEWSDVDTTKRTITIRDRKEPRRKDENHQVVPLLNSTGYGAWQLVPEQRIVTRGIGRVFRYNRVDLLSAKRRGDARRELPYLVKAFRS